MVPSSRRPTRRAPRLDLVVLAVVATCVIALLTGLTLRMHHDRALASEASYPQLSQPVPTLAVPTTAFIGDSYSAGTGSSGYDSRFTTLVAAYEGWSSQSFAFGGTGYLRAATTSARTGCGTNYCPRYREVIAAVRAYDPTIVVVSGGRNDVGMPQAEVEPAIDRFYTELRAALPEARIIVTSPVWAYSEPPAQLARIQTAVQRAAARVGATYLDLGEPLVDDRSLVAADRVHPNDRGHASLAQNVEVLLSRAGSTPGPAPTVRTP